MGPLTLLIKPVSGSCNIRCKYCFYFDEMQHRSVKNFGVMCEATLENMVKKSFDFASGVVTFAFQGGEPTLAGLDYYRTFISLVKKYNTRGLRVNYSLQTNGLNLHSEWMDFFKENNFLIGVSLDGTEEIHNRYRIDQGGEGTWSRVLDGVNLLKESGIPFNILCVVNRYVAVKGEEVYKNLKKLDLRYLQFIPCMDEMGPGNKRYIPEPQEYGEFLVKIFDLFEKDIYERRFVSIRYFDNLLSLLAGYSPEACSMQGVCSANTVVEADGSLFPCDFYVLDQWGLGNINTSSIKESRDNPVMERFLSQSRNVHHRCQKCPWVRLCRGGCRRYRDHSSGGSLKHNYYCQGFKHFFKGRADSLVRLYNYVILHPLKEV